MGGICYVPSRAPASETSGRQTGGKSTDLSLSLFNLTRQAALGTFQSIFKLTIYNQFSKAEGGGWRRGAAPVIVGHIELGGGDDNTAACCQTCQQVR